jgi:hypothetical protein
MAPFGQFKPTSITKPNPKLATPIDDDATWDDLAEKPETKESSVKSDSASSPRPSPVIPPLPVQGQPIPNSYPLPPAPLGHMGPISPAFGQHPYGGPPHEPFARLPPTEQQLLEAQLVHIAEVNLGYLNAMHALEAHIAILPPVANPNQIYITIDPAYSPHTTGGVSHAPPRGVSRSYFYQNERQNYTYIVKEMGYLLGLRRAIKILNAAVADTEREDVKYNFALGPPRPQPPIIQPAPPMMVPIPQQGFMQAPHSLALPNSPDKELRSVARDIVKDAVREYKDNVINPGVEEVQKEMIKLLRDVCRDALAADKHH